MKCRVKLVKKITLYKEVVVEVSKTKDLFNEEILYEMEHDDSSMFQQSGTQVWVDSFCTEEE
jgi:hypothetical protein